MYCRKRQFSAPSPPREARTSGAGQLRPLAPWCERPCVYCTSLPQKESGIADLFAFSIALFSLALFSLSVFLSFVAYHRRRDSDEDGRSQL